jgi:Reverse transcriptase (RNA-dependent DNA polymerase)
VEDSDDILASCGVSIGRGWSSTASGIQVPRPNTTPQFAPFLRKNPLVNSPSPLQTQAWASLLVDYPGHLPTTLVGILTFGCEIGSNLSLQARNCKNQISCFENPSIISQKIAEDLALGRIRVASSPIVTSPLGLVPKGDSGWRRIHNLSSPLGDSVNCHIPPEFGTLEYTTVSAILEHVRNAGRGCILIKRDVKDAFRTIPLSIQSRRLMGFHWRGVTYEECCLSFGLRTAPFLFNLFAEGLHWILATKLPCPIEHYLDDFIFILQNATNVAYTAKTYIEVTDTLGVPRNDSKDAEGTEVIVLGYTIDTALMEIRLSEEKQAKALVQIDAALQHGSLSLHQAQQLSGRLSWSAVVIRLGRSYSRSLWTFMTNWPAHLKRHMPRRFSSEVRNDLQLWRESLTVSNGIRFLDDSHRDIFHLFTDASSQVGYGGFYFRESSELDHWPAYLTTLPQCNAFATLPPDRQVEDHINQKEMHAVAEAFTRWSPNWKRASVCIHTDSLVASQGLVKTVLKGPGNLSLRAIVLAAVQYDIAITTS